MGNPKQKWTPEEEGALRAGVQKHGTGKWRNILKDPEFAPLLANRSNIDLKDKWRNLSINTGQSSRDKSKTPRAKPGTSSAGASSSTPASVVVVDDNAADDTSKGLQEETNEPFFRYNSMILEAITSLNEPNGSDLGSILRYIEENGPVPSSFRRVLGSKLRRLVLQGKLEKNQNRFLMKVESEGAKPDSGEGPSQRSGSVAPTAKELDGPLALIAEAENKSFVAAESVKEFERISKLADDSDCQLEVVKFILEQTSRGRTILV